jgi:3-phenylpropionate/trans-cinnamate dioxygenase ferredoxin subunit
MRVAIGEREIVVFHVAGEYFALLDRCPHQGGHLADGVLCGLVQASEPGRYRYSRPGEFVRCPWHGWEFDLRTGKSVFNPDRVRTRRYQVSIAPGSLVAEGPYRAETFPVRVEDTYVVVEA